MTPKPTLTTIARTLTQMVKVLAQVKNSQESLDTRMTGLERKSDNNFKRTDQRLGTLENKYDENFTRIDKTIGLYQRQELELAAAGLNYNQHEQRITKLEQHVFGRPG